jgi:type IV fimbrial biogenesis protein FimT
MSSASNQGFTLIEMIIALAIVAILVAIAVPNFRTFLLNVQIRTATEALNNGLQLARGEAVRRNTNVKFILGNDSGWSVGCETPVPDNDGDGTEDCPTVIQSRLSEEGSTLAKIAVTPAGSTIATFNGLGRLTNNDDGSFPISRLDVDMPIATLAASQSKDLSILIKGGSVYMCNPNIASADPKACPTP